MADTRRLNAKPQDLTDAYGPPSNFLEIDIFNPQTVGMGRARYTSYELRMRVRPLWGSGRAEGGGGRQASGPAVRRGAPCVPWWGCAAPWPGVRPGEGRQRLVRSVGVARGGRPRQGRGGLAALAERGLRGRGGERRCVCQRPRAARV